MQKRFCKITLSILALAAATVFAVFYYRLYTSPVFQYRGAYYQTQVNDDETRYAASDGTISVLQTDSGSTVTITYEWNAPQTFLIEQNGQAITVEDRKGIVLLQGIWQNGALLNTSGGVNETYASQKSAWLDNQHASVQRPVPPNAAEALDIAMGANIVQRGKGLAPKYDHAGIYCIKIDSTIVYIGKSRNMLRRVAQHYVGIKTQKEKKYRILAEA